MAGRFLVPSALFGQSLKENFVLEPVLVKESISLYVTEPVTDVLLECAGKKIEIAIALG